MTQLMKRLTFLLLAGVSLAAAQPFTYTPYRGTGIYEVGETVGWKLTPAGGSGHFKYVIRRNNLDVLKSGSLDFSMGPAVIEVQAAEPSMIYVEIDPDPAPAKPDPKTRIALGAAVSPRKLQLSAPRPADFDSFWGQKLEALSKVPINPVLTPVETGVAGVETSQVKLDSLGSHVQGYLAKPAREGKFPALVIYQYAGVYALKTQTVTTRAAQGWLAFDVDSHDMPPSDSTGPPTDYYTIGNSDREKSYFLNMYLRDARVIDYIMSRPDWDGHTIVLTGTSMGGQQSLVTAGLRADKITAVVVNEPSGADTNGSLHGRKPGYPNWPVADPKVAETALYFDPANFASRIKAPTLVAIGFVDTTSPPAGLWTVLNQIPVPDEAVCMIESDHDNRTPDKQAAWDARSREVLDMLLQGGTYRPRPDPKSPDQPAPRTDANSMAAHQQLLDKRTKGKIDVYFEGDSITRRWGATDYPDYLANWNQNFHGWNAADFGWGADRLENILWRLDNGELDGVSPKVIVLLAGTNNVPNSTPADITSGIRAILHAMQAKAPSATIILTAIFPRNDNPAYMPVINEVNRNLEILADGKRIRFLNVNDKLAGPDGKLFDGMMNNDKLHPGLKGYQVWADGLKPILTELLGPPKNEDQAPPPTGDPKVR
jgi:cephalosporin-C deacetylase-like acetyl esterase/lysophospholipase L1-like esterase